jgi:hypothetical protein
MTAKGIPPRNPPISEQELLTEIERLAKWWRTDASYRAPEDPLFHYAQGNADALERVVHMLKRDVPPLELK